MATIQLRPYPVRVYYSRPKGFGVRQFRDVLEAAEWVMEQTTIQATIVAAHHWAEPGDGLPAPWSYPVP